jgi:hypothetical protein
MTTRSPVPPAVLLVNATALDVRVPPVDRVAVLWPPRLDWTRVATPNNGSERDTSSDRMIRSLFIDYWVMLTTKVVCFAVPSAINVNAI